MPIENERPLARRLPDGAPLSAPLGQRAHILGARFHVQISRVRDAGVPGHAHAAERVAHLVGPRHCKGVSGEIVVAPRFVAPRFVRHHVEEVVRARDPGPQSEGGTRTVGLGWRRALVEREGERLTRQRTRSA
jgi:hypothetical protein